MKGAPFVVCLCFALACRQTTTYVKNPSHASVPDRDIAAGQRLAATYCQSCHLLPDPSLLASKTWEKGVLPQMGPRLGIFFHGLVQYAVDTGPFTRMPKGFYPDKPMMSDDEWQQIIYYYTAVSPDSLPAQQRPAPLRADSTLFAVSTPSRRYIMPLTAMIRVDSVHHSILLSDVERRYLYTIDAGLRYTDSMPVAGAIVDVAGGAGAPNGLVALNIGEMFPTNAMSGSTVALTHRASGWASADTAAVFRFLHRPVQLLSADLNGDGRPDYLVCEFGYTEGRLSWMENTGHGFIEHTIRPVPGAIQARIYDYNHDGKPDIFVAFAQGDEGIWLFTNKGGGLFDGSPLLRFPPCYGTSYFELDDFDGDGHPDILYTCGDNADYSKIRKPYHGVYIFMNDGHEHYTQRYFYPIDGCYRAMARDFSGTGRLDIAAIAYFADYQRQPEEGFVFLKRNAGSLSFTPWSVPATEAGRWMTMDVGDLDGDGHPEIVLGNCSTGPFSFQPRVDFKQGPPFMVLRLNRR
ncbi:MAG TPA: FG-GAP-like repeat-containing protein [Dinghuibacter sp.]|uniref:FG-GAP-like repeat-containing protein n=1 Tax=Dinghuibacter sp. TaxID=2024697 RepID=UPI002CD1F19B|nr:FG-GAP-like repeat-containing protein [Dinghuibacter sp.]HTJ10872.1 FG-GAP-like repeat-containing protein [Dinghuibacter sp.]